LLLPSPWRCLRLRPPLDRLLWLFCSAVPPPAPSSWLACFNLLSFQNIVCDGEIIACLSNQQQGQRWEAVAGHASAIKLPATDALWQ
jgi:hypothetical protein